MRANLPKWRELQIAFRRLEARGEIRGGRFVDGFIGEQFALPVAVESVRATRKMPLSGEVVTLSAADPLNLVGVIVPGERIPAISGRTVSYRDGVALEDEPRLKPVQWRFRNKKISGRCQGGPSSPDIASSGENFSASPRQHRRRVVNF